MKKKKKVDPKITTEDLADDCQEILDTLVGEWNRYAEEGVKKGATEARKLSLSLKKKATELRASFKDLDL